MMYVGFGYEACVKVAEELGISLPMDEPLGQRDSDISSGFVKGQELLPVADRFLNIQKFEKPELLKEALTHPSSIYEDVPCYQKLEWIGDAVLCLAMRSWVYRTYPGLDVAELVILESMLVCNETLAFLGFSEGLHRLMNHRDPSLPRRFEEFQRDIGKQGRGLWGT